MSVTVIVYVIWVPATTVLLSATLRSATSAFTVTVSVSFALLLPAVGSVTAELTEAVFVWSPVVDDGTVNVTVIDALPFLAIVPSAHVKFVVLVVVSHVPWLEATAPRVNPVGQLSLTE